MRAILKSTGERGLASFDERGVLWFESADRFGFDRRRVSRTEIVLLPEEVQS